MNRTRSLWTAPPCNQLIGLSMGALVPAAGVPAAPQAFGAEGA